MKQSEFKQLLHGVDHVTFLQPNGAPVPVHFHITEAGLVTKQFIDCGGTVRADKTIAYQLWVAADTEHRLEPHKLLGIISTYEKLFGNDDLDVEVEYQTQTIGKYAVGFADGNFLLLPKHTDCLAKDTCGQPEALEMEMLSAMPAASQCCIPGGGCC